MTDHLKFPTGAILDADGVHLTFAAIGVSEFVDAFSHETTARHSQAVVTRVSYPWARLAAYETQNSNNEPRGLIFHTARVGSTLQSRMLRCCNSPRSLPRKKAESVMIIALADSVRNRAGRVIFRQRSAERFHW